MISSATFSFNVVIGVLFLWRSTPLKSFFCSNCGELKSSQFPETANNSKFSFFKFFFRSYGLDCSHKSPNWHFFGVTIGFRLLRLFFYESLSWWYESFTNCFLFHFVSKNRSTFPVMRGLMCSLKISINNCTLEELSFVKHINCSIPLLKFWRSKVRERCRFESPVKSLHRKHNIKGRGCDQKTVPSFLGTMCDFPECPEGALENDLYRFEKSSRSVTTGSFLSNYCLVAP